MMQWIEETSPRSMGRIAGVFYLLTFLVGGAAFLVRGRLSSAANLVSGASYMAVTLLFYYIFKPVNRNISLIAAFFSVAGFTVEVLDAFHLAPLHINPLVFFGVYCLLIGYLILRSTFLPRTLGVLMVIGGVGWLTFASQPLAHYLSPYNMAPGILGEGALTLWLLVFGVDERQWKEMASAQRTL